MKSFVATILLLALAVCASAEDVKQQATSGAKTTEKRGIYGLGYGYPDFHAPLTYPAAPLALPSTYVSPLKYHAPLSSYPLSYHAPLPYHAPLSYHAPLPYHAPLSYHAPLPYHAPISYPYHAPIYKAPYFAPSLY